MELEPVALSLPELLEQGLALVRERAARQALSVSLDVAPEVGIVWADEIKLKQVVVNLLTNAVKFTPAGGRVDVAAWVEGDEVLVTVRDNGVGIAAADQARIFEAFQRGDRRMSAEGTGLGLTLSKRFVELHGGRMWLSSALGRGEHVRLRDPGAPVLGRARRRGRRTPRRRCSSRTWPAAGHRIIVARDGAEALELAQMLHPRAVIVDGPDGAELLAQLKVGIPVVLVSPGKGDATALLDALERVL